jgi:hypothetical protein
MTIEVNDTTHQVFLKTNAYDSENGNQVDTVPLKATQISVSVNRTVPALPIPLSSIARGESETVAVDLGMGSKSINVSGVITNGFIRRSHTKTGETVDALKMTAEEIAQLIASGVDSSGLAVYQNFNELVFLIESNIDENFDERSAVQRIPFTFASRGASNKLDNKNVPLPANFPTSETSVGVGGFIESFDFTLSGDAPTEIEFSLSFKVARVFPQL